MNNIIRILNDYHFVNLIILLCMNIYSLVYFLKIKQKNQLEKDFKTLFLLQTIYTIIAFIYLILGIWFNNYEKFKILDNLSHLVIELIPVFLFFISLEFLPEKIKLNRKLFYIIPIITNIIILTNDLHHLYYTKYSIYISELDIGMGYMLNATYVYLLSLTTMIIILKSSISQSGFLSRTSLIILLGVLTPIIINLLGTLHIINMSTFTTPVILTLPSVLFALAIFKYKALDMIPVSLRTIVNNMSDSYIVISNRGTVIDKNKTFDKTFFNIIDLEIGDNSFSKVQNINKEGYELLKYNVSKAKKERKFITIEYKTLPKTGKYFQVDIQPIKAARGYYCVGTLLLFKDITEHKKHIETIKADQDIIVSQAQLASIGELAGSFAHDINTPINTIKTGVSMLNKDLDKKTESEIISKVNNSINKIIKVINSVKNQMQNLNNNEKKNFKISSIINEVKTLTYWSLKENNCTLNIKVEDDLTIYGSQSKLVQVLNNLIINAIEAYNGKKGKIEIIAIKAPKDKLLIKVIDYAGGIDPKIKDHVFKEMLTFKGSRGTGLGLYITHSVIQGEFKGEITFETEENEGTTFYIILNIIKEANI